MRSFHRTATCHCSFLRSFLYFIYSRLHVDPIDHQYEENLKKPIKENEKWRNKFAKGKLYDIFFDYLFRQIRYKTYEKVISRFRRLLTKAIIDKMVGSNTNAITNLQLSQQPWRKKEMIVQRKFWKGCVEVLWISVKVDSFAVWRIEPWAMDLLAVRIVRRWVLFIVHFLNF